MLPQLAVTHQGGEICHEALQAVACSSHRVISCLEVLHSGLHYICTPAATAAPRPVATQVHWRHLKAAQRLNKPADNLKPLCAAILAVGVAALLRLFFGMLGYVSLQHANSGAADCRNYTICAAVGMSFRDRCRMQRPLYACELDLVRCF